MYGRIQEGALVVSAIPVRKNNIKNIVYLEELYNRQEKLMLTVLLQHCYIIFEGI
jgi:hypothetical protein